MRVLLNYYYMPNANCLTMSVFVTKKTKKDLIYVTAETPLVFPKRM